MKEKSDSILDFFNMVNNGKVVISEKKAKWEFIEKYSILLLIFFTIYRITFYIVDIQFMDTLNNFGTTITDVEDYIHTVKNQECILSIICIAIILCNFIVVFVSSFSFFNKYSIKKDYCKEIQKTIIIIELIFIGVISFYFYIHYSDKHEAIHVDKYRIETLLGINNNQEDNKQVDKYLETLDNLYLINFVSLELAEIFCAISCVLIQRKIMETNCI